MQWLDLRSDQIAVIVFADTTGLFPPKATFVIKKFQIQICFDVINFTNVVSAEQDRREESRYA